ncbi:MAG: integrase core domain-containing protein [Bacteroidales bacterium]|nr:integrase core domain-containing protein [Bacteroidales bacterium]
MSHPTPLSTPPAPRASWSRSAVPRCRRPILDAYIFRNIEEVRELTEKWRTDYNENRPHEALGNMTPMEYKHMLLTGEIRSMGHSVPAAAANP